MSINNPKPLTIKKIKKLRINSPVRDQKPMEDEQTDKQTVELNTTSQLG